LAVIPPASGLTAFTWFTAARVHAGFYGFFSMTMFGAIYYIVPRVAGVEFPFAKLVRAHLGLATAGILLIVFPLAIRALVQGSKLTNPNIAFTDVSKATLPFLRASTLGDLLIGLGHLVFLVNLAGVASRFLQPRARASYVAATSDLFHPAETKP